MCAPHWRMVPRKLQRYVWANYRRGQVNDMRPSIAWHLAADAAIAAVAIRDGCPFGKLAVVKARALWTLAPEVCPEDARACLGDGYEPLSHRQRRELAEHLLGGKS